MAEHFKEPLERIDKLIDKLEANVGVAHEAPVEVKCHMHGPAPEKKHEQAPAPQQPKAVKCAIFVPGPEVKTETAQAVTPAQQTEPKVVKCAIFGPAKTEGAPAELPKEAAHTAKEAAGVKQEKKQKPKKEVEKKEKVEKAEKTEAKEQTKEEPLVATVDDFAQLDIRIGQIKECWKHPASENLYCEKIDIGGQIRQIASGLQKYVPIDNMQGQVLVFANLKPRKLADFMSNGMVMANSNNDRSDIRLVNPKGKVGERIVLQGHEAKFTQDKLPVLNPKKKVLEKCIDKFTTDIEGVAMWNGIKLKTSEGFIVGPIPNGHLS